MTGLLRNEMRFQGIIISDAMDMRGVLDQYGAVEAVKRAVAAGIDVLIQPLSVPQTIDAVVAGVQEGRYTEARLNESVRRILRSKASLGLHKSKLVDLNALRFVVGDSAHVNVSNRIAAQSITLVKDSLNYVPLLLPQNAKILSVAVARRADLSAGIAFNSELRARYPGLRSEVLIAEDPSADYARMERAADSADVTIVSSYVGQSWDAVSATAPKSFTNFLDQLRANGRRLIVVSFGNPYLLQQIPGVPAYVIGWGGFPASQTAAARALLGMAPITGKLPITIPMGSGAASIPFGSGITRATTSK
jgi:beta-N-acetylhexosaminidase